MDPVISPWLIPLFALTALIYASVGFAGGSTYTALMVLAGMPMLVVPLISLICNVIVSSGGMVRFSRAGHVPYRRVWPMLLLSMPAAWFGGWVEIEPALFVLLLGGSLIVAGLLLLIGPEQSATRAPAPADAGPGLFGLLIAAPLGLLSGLVGIGGGIFLAPILHLVGWDSSRRIAGTASLFIFVNSLTGLAGQGMKLAYGDGADDIAAMGETLGHQALIWGGLIVGVAIGGQIGSFLGSVKLPQVMIRRLTGGVVLFAGMRLMIG